MVPALGRIRAAVRPGTKRPSEVVFWAYPTDCSRSGGHLQGSFGHALCYAFRWVPPRARPCSRVGLRRRWLLWSLPNQTDLQTAHPADRLLSASVPPDGLIRTGKESSFRRGCGSAEFIHSSTWLGSSIRLRSTPHFTGR